jgi:hypothetical protein
MSFNFKLLERAVARLKIENPNYTFVLSCSLIGSGLGGIVEIGISNKGSFTSKAFLVPRPSVTSEQDYMIFIQGQFTEVNILLPSSIKSYQTNDRDAQV